VNIDRILQNAKAIINFDIKYKDESKFMKLLGMILFFNKNFSKSYLTTINNTIYLPNKQWLESKPISSISTILHELVHVSDKNKYGFLLFTFAYLFPQILLILSIPLIIISWKFIIISLFLISPIPALGRAYLEYRAYCMTIYVLYVLTKQYGLNVDFSTLKSNIVNQFTSSSYYFMFPFKNIINSKLNNVIENCLKNKHPFEDKIFIMADKILEKN